MARPDQQPRRGGTWTAEWERRRIRNRLHLTFTGCLGPCAVGDNAVLQLYGRSIWLKDLNDAATRPLIFDYAEAMLAAGGSLPPPSELATHVYERFIDAATADTAGDGHRTAASWSMAPVS